MEKTIKEMTVEELKVLGFDIINQNAINQQNLQAIQGELQQRAQIPKEEGADID